jgi:hypothetical protein
MAMTEQVVLGRSDLGKEWWGIVSSPTTMEHLVQLEGMEGTVKV